MDRKLSIAELVVLVGAFALALGSLRLFLYMIPLPTDAKTQAAYRTRYVVDAASAFIAPLYLVVVVLSTRRTPPSERQGHAVFVAGPTILGLMASILSGVAYHAFRRTGGGAAVERIYGICQNSGVILFVCFVMLAVGRRLRWPQDRLEWSAWALIACWMFLIFLPVLV
ncbi:hypothetical protein [Paludisphaera rhizosphaerae]|uniref:hypothetical protein n=1 Tax=Paludisphaera rhizosphaerae TaxID=2711216 RepID=UPI0013EC3F28|nr:hypothetical protein [Paludisphaera rhizosphaerae]